jgi:hypothetical protein
MSRTPTNLVNRWRRRSRIQAGVLIGSTVAAVSYLVFVPIPYPMIYMSSEGTLPGVYRNIESGELKLGLSTPEGLWQRIGLLEVRWEMRGEQVLFGHPLRTSLTILTPVFEEHPWPVDELGIGPDDLTESELFELARQAAPIIEDNQSGWHIPEDGPPQAIRFPGLVEAIREGQREASWVNEGVRLFAAVMIGRRVAWILLAFALVAAVAALARDRFLYARHRARAARGDCANCGYPLADLPDPVCPECGYCGEIESAGLDESHPRREP